MKKKIQKLKYKNKTKTCKKTDKIDIEMHIDCFAFSPIAILIK